MGSSRPASDWFGSLEPVLRLKTFTHPPRARALERITYGCRPALLPPMRWPTGAACSCNAAGLLNPAEASSRPTCRHLCPFPVSLAMPSSRSSLSQCHAARSGARKQPPGSPRSRRSHGLVWASALFTVYAAVGASASACPCPMDPLRQGPAGPARCGMALSTEFVRFRPRHTPAGL